MVLMVQMVQQEKMDMMATEIQTGPNPAVTVQMEKTEQMVLMVATEEALLSVILKLQQVLSL